MQGEGSQYVSVCSEVKINYTFIIANTAHKIVYIGYRLDVAVVNIAAKFSGEAVQRADLSVELTHDGIFKPETGLVYITAVAVKCFINRNKKLNSEYCCALGFDLFVDGENYVAFL